MKTIRLGGLLAVASLFAASAAGAADTDKTKGAHSSCHQETKRVAVWPRTAPKAPQMARFEQRELTICDGKVVSSRPVPKDQLHANDTEG